MVKSKVSLEYLPMHLAQCFFYHHHHHHHNSSFNVDGTYLVTLGCVCVCVCLDPMHLRVHIRRVVTLLDMRLVIPHPTYYMPCFVSRRIMVTCDCDFMHLSLYEEGGKEGIHILVENLLWQSNSRFHPLEVNIYICMYVYS
jgi:hypothetical protein